MGEVMLMKRPELCELPKWQAPKDLRQAKTEISTWGRNMHEHAYLVGKHLAWVKKEVGHGKFGKWLADNVWFKQQTASAMMRFTKRCEKNSMLLEYHGHVGESKIVLNTNLKPQASHLKARENMLKKIDDLEGKSFTDEEWRKKTTWQQRISFSLIPWVNVKEDGKHVELEIDEELKDVCDERYHNLEKNDLANGDNVGHLIGDKIDHLLASLDQKNRDVAIFWIESALNSYKETK